MGNVSRVVLLKKKEVDDIFSVANTTPTSWKSESDYLETVIKAKSGWASKQI